ncbi:hypothetical protein AFM12_05425 [Jiulongibacter sediminis]|uniref:Prenyltransferase n=1 Tax=Jiulongibacter sediminis TaxID=1605367 RepID=A0A0P7CB59_9BACT|nr:hypothetical protein AFM12_05425 [Jiulongibacter sediminis]TBX27024.1 hypothetical protein TK44_05430 [Jiulongibacter sediminis]
MKPFLKFLHLLSLDVVLGAMLTSVMFWRLPDGSGPIEMSAVILLGISTWVIYILDRLLDLRIYPENLSERHRFHADHQYNLSILLVVLSVIGLVFCFLIPLKVLTFGACISLTLVVYFYVLNKVFNGNKLIWMKEPVTAVTYTLAVVGIAFVNQSSVNLSGWILAIFLFLIASQNLLLFSYFEDLNEPAVKNTVSYFGQSTSKKIITGIAALIMFLTIFLFSGGWEYINKVALLMMAMSLILSLMPAFENFFLKNDRYRWIGDGVFLLPAILFFV